MAKAEEGGAGADEEAAGGERLQGGRTTPITRTPVGSAFHRRRLLRFGSRLNFPHVL